MIVLDASAALAGLLGAGPARDAMAGDQLHSPHLVDSEVASGLRRLVRSGRITPDEGGRAVGTWARLGLVRYPVHGLLGRIWELRENVSTYDAGYVALAETLECALLTADRRLGAAPGIRCVVTVVPG